MQHSTSHGSKVQDSKASDKIDDKAKAASVKQDSEAYEKYDADRTAGQTAEQGDSRGRRTPRSSAPIKSDSRPSALPSIFIAASKCRRLRSSRRLPCSRRILSRVPRPSAPVEPTKQPTGVVVPPGWTKLNSLCHSDS